MKVKTGSKRPGLRQIDRDIFSVDVKERPVDGKANEAVIRTLAAFFHIPQSRVDLVSGHTAKSKVFEVDL